MPFLLFLFFWITDFFHAIALPDEFDLRKKYPYCPTISTPLDQKECGSCWAFSTTSATSDRLCIQGWTTLTMAPEHPIQCDAHNTGCNGGYVGTAFDFHKTDGLVVQDCKEYLNEMPRTCSKKCDNKEPIEPNMLYKTDGKTRLNTVEKIKEAIYLRGSIVGSYMVYESFNSFYGGIAGTGIASNKEDVFKPENISGAEVTFHAVKFIGWGPNSSNPDQTPYWLIQNSWGKSWADSGYFRIERGKNTAQIEEDVFEPNVPPYYDRCSKFVDCDSCNAVTDLDKPDGSGTEPGRCGFCQATDQCIEVSVTNKTMADAVDPTLSWQVEVKTPLKGVCPDIATSVCPLDDCLQMSDDPFRCVQHSGCGYCASTRKCRKGNTESQNVGRCNSWEKTATKILPAHKKCHQITALSSDSDDVKGSNCIFNAIGETCGFCMTSGLCLSANEFMPEITNLGRCPNSHYWWYFNKTAGQPNYVISQAQTEIAAVASSCSYTTKERCDKQSSCFWNKNTKACLPTGSTTLLTESAGLHLSNGPSPLPDDTSCLGEKCGECNARPECRYCTTTQSCLAYEGVSPTGNTTQTTCSLLSEPDDTPDDLCNDCGSYPSCYECALKAKCGWWTQLGLCMAGRVEGPFDPNSTFANSNHPLNKYRYDNFTSFKMNCPFVIEYTYTAEAAAVLGRSLSSCTRLFLWAAVALAGLWAAVL